MDTKSRPKFSPLMSVKGTWIWIMEPLTGIARIYRQPYRYPAARSDCYPVLFLGSDEAGDAVVLRGAVCCYGWGRVGDREDRPVVWTWWWFLDRDRLQVGSICGLCCFSGGVCSFVVGLLRGGPADHTSGSCWLVVFYRDGGIFEELTINWYKKQEGIPKL